MGQKPELLSCGFEKSRVLFPAAVHLRLHLMAFREGQRVSHLTCIVTFGVSWSQLVSLSLLLFCSFPSYVLTHTRPLDLVFL